MLPVAFEIPVPWVAFGAGSSFIPSSRSAAVSVAGPIHRMPVSPLQVHPFQQTSRQVHPSNICCSRAERKEKAVRVPSLKTTLLSELSAAEELL